MLRASIETEEGAEVDFRGLADGEDAEENSLPGAAALIRLVEATLSPDAMAAKAANTAEVARDRVRRELGADALVDAAAIIGNFERMVRIADATGIPLDAPVNVATESLREELGIDRYTAAANTRPVQGWQRALGRAIEPVARFALRRIGRRARSKASSSTES